MAFQRIRETVAVLHESRAAIREGRIAIREARTELENRYRRRERQVESIEQAIDLLQSDGPDTDLRRLLVTLAPAVDSDRRDEHASNRMT